MLRKLKRMRERRIRALTGLTYSVFVKVLKNFEQKITQAKWDEYEQHKAKRKRKPGGGQKGQLKTMTMKLFFLLYYLRTYPTFDVLGDRFGLDESNANKQVHKLLPHLIEALPEMGMLPARHFASIEEMQAAFEGIEELFIDATERPHSRPKDSQAQRAKYSGKQKTHTVKNTVISDARKRILFLGYTIYGSKHDYGLLKDGFPPELDWFATFKVWVDLGYLGICTDYDAAEIHIPHKKPRKSQKNPQPTLTAEQKDQNRQVSQVRIGVENAIGRMKWFDIVSAKFRNRKPTFVDDVALVTAGLANLMLP